MYKHISILMLSITMLIGGNPLQQYEGTIYSVDKNTALIKSHPIVEVGSSGVIMHSFDNSHQAISKGIEVIQKDDKFTKIKFSDFGYLKQNALPSYNITPKKGDKVILNYLYNKALAITPNHQTLKYIEDKYPSIEWVHPDILAIGLVNEGDFSPTIESFQEVCKSNTFALLFFAVKESGYFVDCNSFKIIHSTKIQSSHEKITPFYSRIDIEDGSFLNFGTNKVKNYDKFYKKLLGITQ